jgi:predicted Zn finger-like uncharacterized protein
MDVRCEQCGTEYEFDDAKVTDAGIAVKCTHCGFLFRVTRHAVTVDERPVLSEARPVRAVAPTATAPALETPVLPRAGTPPRPKGWMIRKERSGDILEFKDLSTLQKWILERKVSRDDEISKTGESWKPLGSIVELSSFFLVVEGETLRAMAQVPEPPISPTASSVNLAALRPGLAPPAPPRGRDDLLDTGQFRLEGPGEPGSSGPTPPPSTPSTAPLPVSPPAPAPAATAPQPAPGIAETGTIRRVQMPPAEPTPQVTVFRTPAPRPGLSRQEASVPDFELSSASAPVGRGNTARGFVIGVGVTGALFAVAYGAFEHLNQERTRTLTTRPLVTPSAPSSAAPASATPAPAMDLATRLDAADARVRTDADAELDQAIPEYDAVLAALGDPPSDRVLAARTLVGKARVLLARAEHRKLGGELPGGALAKVNDLLGAARVHAPDLPDIDLAWADSLRLREERVSVRNFLDAAAPKASSRPEYAFLRAMNDGSEDPAAIADRLAALPPESRNLPRVLLLRGLALERAGRLDEARQVANDLLRASPSHAQGIDLRARLLAQAPASVPPPPVPASAPPVPASAAAPPSAPVSVAASPRSAAPEPIRIGEDPAAIHPGDDFDGLMLRGARLLENGKPEAAARLFERAAQQKPRSPEPYANLGWCRVDQRKYAEALAQFQQALDRSPRYSDALYGMAEAYEKAGRSAEAVSAYKTYLEAHPSGRRSEMARRRLERLQ